MVVKIGGKTVRQSSDGVCVVISVLPDVISLKSRPREIDGAGRQYLKTHRVQHLLGKRDGDGNDNPVLGWSAGEGITHDTM